MRFYIEIAFNISVHPKLFRWTTRARNDERISVSRQTTLSKQTFGEATHSIMEKIGTNHCDASLQSQLYHFTTLLDSSPR